MHEYQSYSEFEKSTSDKKLTIVKFSAPWCGPCKRLAEEFKKYEKLYPDIKFRSVNVDEHDWVQVRSLPTVEAYRNGKMVGQVVGFDPIAIQKLFTL